MLELFRKLPVDQILRSPYQARKDFDWNGLIGLSDSMRQEGLQCPITTRLIACSDANCQSPKVDSMEGFPTCPEGAHWHLELVSGERRLRAAGILGWPVIDAKVIQTVSEGEARVKGLVENLQRKDLNPMEEAQGMQDLLDLKDGYWTQEQIGKVFGKTQSHISETLRLLDLPEQVKENIRIRIISPDNGAELIRLPTDELRLKAADVVMKKGLNSKATRLLVNKMLNGAKAKVKKTGRPSSDFMAAVWPGLEANTDIQACGHWGVAYKKGQWIFTLSSKTINSKEEIAIWLEQVGMAISNLPLMPLQNEDKKAAHTLEKLTRKR